MLSIDPFFCLFVAMIQLEECVMSMSAASTASHQTLSVQKMSRNLTSGTKVTQNNYFTTQKSTYHGRQHALQISV